LVNNLDALLSFQSDTLHVVIARFDLSRYARQVEPLDLCLVLLQRSEL
jgi:hypothetical protein